MHRRNETEILERDDVPNELASQVYRDLARIHRWLGDTRFVIRAIRQDPVRVRRILDVGCGTGLVSEAIGRKLNVEVLGVDLNPRPSIGTSVPVLRADAVRDSLPAADVAFSMLLGHHLSEDDLVELIRNVGRFCRRFILLDLVRHPLPLILFRMCVAPFVCRTVVLDGQRSIRRSYSPAELRRLTASALASSGGSFRHLVAPLYARQVIDILYRE
jgi:SAM-dependent methyltransferase